MNDDYIMTPPSDATRTPVAAESYGVQLPICQRILTTELSGDFSLPDYQPEIKRLLRIGASITPPNGYFSGDSLSMEGLLDYFALYMGNDNRLYCAPLSADYRFDLSLAEERDRERDLGRGVGAASPLDGEMTYACDITADPITGRVTAPRRLNIKCRLKAAAKVYGTCPLSANDQSELSPASIEKLQDTVKTAQMIHAVGETLTLQDDMILSSAEGGDLRVVCAEGQVMIHEATASRDTVICRGDVLLKLTLCPADVPEGSEEVPLVSVRKIPFSQAVEIAGITPDCTCCAQGTCAEMSIEVEEGHLHSELGLILEVLAQKEVTSSYTKDLYSTRRETKESYATYPIERILGCFNGNFTLSDSLPLADTGIHPAARVVDVTATAYPEALTPDKAKQRMILTGRCRVHLLLSREGEYTSAELELPFRYERELPVTCVIPDNSPINFDGGVKTMACRARMDGERIGIDAELAVALRTAIPDTITALSGVTFGEDMTRGRGEYVICFPSVDDTLWSVAKRYHAPMAALSAANDIPLPERADEANSLRGSGFLIV